MANPYNDQVAAALDRDLEILIGAARHMRDLARGHGQQYETAMQMQAIGNAIEMLPGMSESRAIAILAAALMRLTRDEAAEAGPEVEG